MKSLSRRELVFVMAIVTDGANLTEAAKLAGYSERTAQQQSIAITKRPHVALMLRELAPVALGDETLEGHNRELGRLRVQALREGKLALAFQIERARGLMVAEHLDRRGPEGAKVVQPVTAEWLLGGPATAQAAGEGSESPGAPSAKPLGGGREDGSLSGIETVE